MTVAELIVELQKQNPTAPVVITWEGVFRKTAADMIYAAPNGFVVLDADENHYRDLIAMGRLEPWEPDR